MMNRFPSKPLTEQQALSRLSALCARGEHSCGELADKMRRWGLPREAQERVIAWLVDKRFVDDERYARAFIADKITYNAWGRHKIEQGLRAKQVSSSVYGPLLDDVSDDEYLRVLRPLLRAKWPAIKGGTPYECSMKLIRFAMGRGFSVDLVRRAIADLDLPLSAP